MRGGRARRAARAASRGARADRGTHPRDARRRRHAGRFRVAGEPPPLRDGHLPAGRRHHPERLQQDPGLFLRRRAFRARLPGDGLADDGVGARYQVPAPASRDAVHRALGAGVRAAGIDADAADGAHRAGFRRRARVQPAQRGRRRARRHLCAPPYRAGREGRTGGGGGRLREAARGRASSRRRYRRARGGALSRGTGRRRQPFSRLRQPGFPANDTGRISRPVIVMSSRGRTMNPTACHLQAPIQGSLR
ncbi:hypothetical protein BGLA2_490006 [Burkholderia gladioli]|nr:hypothetical protein BGLA2_490006 [Burkholderia gladioli]